MKLGALWPEAPASAAGVEIAGVAADSRAVAPGFIFVAIPGAKADGAVFIDDAVARGAVAVISEREAAANRDIVSIATADARAALAVLASRFHARQPARIVAVTGTSGKTSVAEFTRQILAACGRVAASLGTLGVVTSAGASYGSLTTPDPVALHRTLAELADAGITDLVMEASSHGLDQKRLDGVRLKAAAFTNLGRDHLDYHADIDAYLAAKLRLFDSLLPADGAAVINMDGARAGDALRVARARGLRTLTVGRAGADLTLRDIARDGFAQRLSLAHSGGARMATLPLIGEFQVENALTAAGLAIALGEDADAVVEAFAALRGAPGRLERIGEARGGLALIDYAHKPEALTAALTAVRPFATGRLILVFGCGGDRDRGKRPIMGEIAHRLADLVIVTDDNPRSEPPAAIRRAILAAAPGAREIGDRADAIRAAVREMNMGDVILVAGKGHETGQIVGDRTWPFSDHEVVSAALREIGA
jgi:UDP-N-acetylmuramoyl-L-alanyl-D-glutamate--2,6-diaminopimelate ligase